MVADVSTLAGLFLGAWAIGFTASYKLLIFKKSLEIST